MLEDESSKCIVPRSGKIVKDEEGAANELTDLVSVNYANGKIEVDPTKYT
jgi:hypothetical protein